MTSINHTMRTGNGASFGSIPDARRAVLHAGTLGTTAYADATWAMLKSNAKMDAQLITDFSYTQDFCNTLSMNDKVYALRLAHEAGSFT